jgi:hypothetical protein
MCYYESRAITSSHFGTILWNNMMGHPTLRCRFEDGNFNKSKELRYSIRYKL